MYFLAPTLGKVMRIGCFKASVTSTLRRVIAQVGDNRLEMSSGKEIGGIYNERKNASYALYDFSWAFLAFPHLGKYVGKSLATPLPIPRLLRWNITKSDNIVEGDPFKYKGRSTETVHPYLTPTVREMEQNYMALFKPYTDEVNDTTIFLMLLNY
ncbi:hypothetical protein H5410_032467 [Solanum commersonii]|uniref:Uncharacterized protein n=1 Tax=Solanum commersonii TaxID=4109 RepID=A0A9J5YL54_SOLCO|nr:hypothetical protein H5410_032467 [Solanum commersonii]